MTGVKTAIITRDVIENAYNYEEYRELIEELLDKGKTTGENYSETMLHYTKMNLHRMERLGRQIELRGVLSERLKNVERSMIWLVLTEGWSRDAAQMIPVIQKMAEQTKRIQTRYILRDQHHEIMDRFLSEREGRTVPKLICLDAQTLNVLGEWGPRPNEAQELMNTLNNQEEHSSRSVSERMHKWYSDDRTFSVQDEFLPLLDEWENRM